MLVSAQLAVAEGLVGAARRPGSRLARPWTIVLGLSLWFWLMPLFLDGHLPSPRWRGVAWFYRLLAVPGIDSLALLPGAQPGGTALVGVAAVSMIMRLRRAKEANVNDRAEAVGRDRRWHPESRLVVVAGSGHLTCGHRNIAAALRRNARDATRLLPLFGITSR